MVFAVRRFYRHAAIAKCPDGYAIRLDGRGMRTPAGAELRLPTAALAEAVAAEWKAQGETIDPETMPLTRLMATAIDRVARCREEVVERMVAYGAADLLCYRAVGPADLVLLQHRLWQPLLDWVAATLGARLEVTSGVVPVTQPPETLAALRAPVAALNDLALTALASAVQATGSLIVGLALILDYIRTEEACAAAQLDERYQAERWGVDAEAEERRRRVASEIGAAARFSALTRIPGDNSPPQQARGKGETEDEGGRRSDKSDPGSD